MNPLKAMNASNTNNTHNTQHSDYSLDNDPNALANQISSAKQGHNKTTDDTGSNMYM